VTEQFEIGCRFNQTDLSCPWKGSVGYSQKPDRSRKTPMETPIRNTVRSYKSCLAGGITAAETANGAKLKPRHESWLPFRTVPFSASMPN
jgi:hypothetical protein